MNLGLSDWGFPGDSVGKESAYNERDSRLTGSIPSQGDPLEEGKTTHSSVLAWRILWAKEPGGLQTIGSQTTGHD